MSDKFGDEGSHPDLIDSSDLTGWCQYCSHSVRESAYPFKFIRYANSIEGPFCSRRCSFDWLANNDERLDGYLDHKPVGKEVTEFVE